MDASAWLSDFERVERNVDDAFACLYERDAAQREGRAADATELTATVRKQAAELRSELDALGASLELSSVTDREKIRREDLVAGLYGRCDELAGLSSADAGYVSSSPPSSTNLFQPEPDSHRGETPATVDLDNTGIQLQRNMMMRQDDELDELSRVVTSTKHIGLAVNEELDLHARLLDDIEDEVTRTGSRLQASSPDGSSGVQEDLELPLSHGVDSLSHCADITRVRGAEALVNQVRRVLVLAQKRRREMKKRDVFCKTAHGVHVRT